MYSFELGDLQAKVTRVESVQSEVDREPGGIPALAATLMGDGMSRGGDGNIGATRGGK